MAEGTGNQKPEFGVHFDGIGDSIGHFLANEFAIPLAEPLCLFSACSINSRGEIIGLALDMQGHGYLATPNNGVSGGSDDLSTVSRTARFDYAWSVIRERVSQRNR
jgi:hypothetical protein